MAPKKQTVNKPETDKKQPNETNALTSESLAEYRPDVPPPPSHERGTKGSNDKKDQKPKRASGKTPKTKETKETNEKKKGTNKSSKKERKENDEEGSGDENPEMQQRKLSPVSYPLASQVKKTLMEMYPDNSIKNVNETKQICEAFLHTIVNRVMEGKNVALINYMTFKRVLRQARMHCNPQTGGEILVDKHYVLGVDVKKDLKQSFKNIPVEEAV